MKSKKLYIKNVDLQVNDIIKRWNGLTSIHYTITIDGIVYNRQSRLKTLRSDISQLLWIERVKVIDNVKSKLKRFVLSIDNVKALEV